MAENTKRRFVTADEAISLLPEGEEIHTFYNMPFGIIGADWEREEVISKIKKSDHREITGEMARGMSHGLAVYNDDTKLQSEVLFIETNKEKLDAFDSQEIKDGSN